MDRDLYIELDEKYHFSFHRYIQLGGPNPSLAHSYNPKNGDYWGELAARTSVEIRSAGDLRLEDTSFFRLTPETLEHLHLPSFNRPLWSGDVLPEFEGDGSVYRAIYYVHRPIPGMSSQAWAPIDQTTTVRHLIWIADGRYGIEDGSSRIPELPPGQEDFSQNLPSFPVMKERKQIKKAIERLYILKTSWDKKDPETRSLEIFPFPGDVEPKAFPVVRR